MHEAVARELACFKSASLETLLVKETYLFGSDAYGSPNQDSDLDLYLVIPDNNMRPIVAMQKIGMTIAQ